MPALPAAPTVVVGPTVIAGGLVGAVGRPTNTAACPAPGGPDGAIGCVRLRRTTTLPRAMACCRGAPADGVLATASCALGVTVGRHCCTLSRASFESATADTGSEGPAGAEVIADARGACAATDGSGPGGTWGSMLFDLRRAQASAMHSTTTTSTTAMMPRIQPRLEDVRFDDSAWLLSTRRGATGGATGGESTRIRSPQSAQSEAYAHRALTEPAAPSLHSPSSAKKHVLVHVYTGGVPGGGVGGGRGGN
mmetsp:Transcript_1022/g.3422  ORF Transcript_1022/g.3422 Transcript_1022/m.3422 type:complete len:251 (-) Transcript_1022:526-1278(-)|eukprot:scaffold43350_cov29-Tisochrysis_lutea.AAC.2